MKKPLGIDLRLLSLLIAVAVTALSLHLDQRVWAAIIYCPASDTSHPCNGTLGNDIIYGSYRGTFIRGLAGNDYIIGASDESNYILGGDGDDILIGRGGNDYLNGGRGNDKYDGQGGDDSILEDAHVEGSLVLSDDIISGGEGNDFILAGFGIDTIHGGTGDDRIYPNTYFHRDFSRDIVDCGPGSGDQIDFYSGDGETPANCEFVTDNDN